jgi:hypothetical protein
MHHTALATTYARGTEEARTTASSLFHHAANPADSSFLCVESFVCDSFSQCCERVCFFFLVAKSEDCESRGQLTIAAYVVPQRYHF